MSNRELFRPEAIDFQQNRRQWGDVASLQPVSTKVLAWFLTAAVALIIIFLFVAQYSRKETALGYLTPTKGTAKIFAPQRGAIKEVHVEEGAAVQEGQPLLTVETNQIDASGTDVNASMVETPYRATGAPGKKHCFRGGAQWFGTGAIDRAGPRSRNRAYSARRSNKASIRAFETGGRRCSRRSAATLQRIHDGGGVQ